MWLRGPWYFWGVLDFFLEIHIMYLCKWSPSTVSTTALLQDCVHHCTSTILKILPRSKKARTTLQMVGEETLNKCRVFHLEPIMLLFSGRTSFHKSPKFLGLSQVSNPQFAPTPSIGAIQHINKKHTLQGTNISNLRTWKIMDSKVPLKGNILVSWRISIAQLLRSQHQTPSMQPKRRWGRKHKHFDYPYKTVLGKSPVEQRSKINPWFGWLKSCTIGMAEILQKGWRKSEKLPPSTGVSLAAKSNTQTQRAKMIEITTGMPKHHSVPLNREQNSNI